MKKLLIISAFYPPRIHIASQRVHAMARHLHSDGFEVHVLTGGRSAAAGPSDGIWVHRVPVTGFPPRFDTSVRSSRWVHKLKAGWNRAVGLVFGQSDFSMERAFLAAARKLVLNHGFSTLITSYGPTPVLKVGLGLKRLHPEILWVADFRDEDAEPSLLDEALRAAELLSTVSSPIVRAMESRREQLGCLEGNGARILEVMNGYDFEEIRDPERPSGCFRIFFAGTFHSQSRPEVFFKALEELIAERGLAPSQIAVTILGGNAGISIPKSLRPMIHITDRVPYRELPRALEGASALLLVLTDHSRQGVYSGKIFDYLAVNRPIVALVNPDDVAAGLVRSCNAGFIGDSSSVEDSKRALTEAYDSWKAGRLPGRDWAKVTAFKRGLLISRLSEAIRNLSANGPA